QHHCTSNQNLPRTWVLFTAAAHVPAPKTPGCNQMLVSAAIVTMCPTANAAPASLYSNPAMLVVCAAVNPPGILNLRNPGAPAATVVVSKSNSTHRVLLITMKRNSIGWGAVKAPGPPAPPLVVKSPAENV